MLRMEGRERLDNLGVLTDVMREELALNEQLLTLCERDSRLGFHSEAEGYKYYPEKIRWRMRHLQRALAEDAPALRPCGRVLTWLRVWQPLGSSVLWGASQDVDAMVVVVSAADAPSQRLVKIEPRRLWPSKHFLFVPGGEVLKELPDTVAPQSVEVRVVKSADGWRVAVRIPFARIGLDPGRPLPLRVDVHVVRKGVLAFPASEVLSPESGDGQHRRFGMASI